MDGNDIGTQAEIYLDEAEMYLQLLEWKDATDDQIEKAKALAQDGKIQELKEFVDAIDEDSGFLTYAIDKREIPLPPEVPETAETHFHRSRCATLNAKCHCGEYLSPTPTDTTQT